MQMFAYRNTEAGIRRIQAPQREVERLEATRSTLLKECASIRAKLEDERSKMEAVRAEAERLRTGAERSRREAQQAVDAANAALKTLHEKWAQEAHEKGWKQYRLVPNPMTLNDVLRRISGAMGISRDDLVSRRRSKHLALARQAAFYWAARRTGHSMAQIGRLMGFDHTTVLHGCSAYREKRAKMGRTLREVR